MAASRVSEMNLPIRRALKDNGLFLYDLEDIWGVSEATRIRKMRKELPENEQAETVNKIKAYKKK